MSPIRTRSDPARATLALAEDLIARRSVCPDDAGCQSLIAERLAALGFSAEHLRFGLVDNLWARRGTESPLLVLAGHTDVVPPGPCPPGTATPSCPRSATGVSMAAGRRI